MKLRPHTGAALETGRGCPILSGSTVVRHTQPPGPMPCGKKRKRHKIATHKRKKRLRKNRHKKKGR